MQSIDDIRNLADTAGLPGKPVSHLFLVRRIRLIVIVDLDCNLTRWMKNRKPTAAKELFRLSITTASAIGGESDGAIHEKPIHVGGDSGEPLRTSRTTPV